MERVSKVLTRNDTGETHSHQSGITIPIRVAETSIFPWLGIEKLNPRVDITFFDENGKMWTFQYIYYNDLYFGKPKGKAHDEHRMTCVREYIKENDIKSGDTVWFSIDDNGVRHIGFIKASTIEEEKVEKIVIKIGHGWKYVKM